MVTRVYTQIRTKPFSMILAIISWQVTGLHCLLSILKSLVSLAGVIGLTENGNDKGKTLV